MKSVFNNLLFLVLLSFSLATQASTVLSGEWKDVARGRCSDQTTAWWSSAEAIRIAENVLLYQKDIGGWPKNINMQLVLSDSAKSEKIAAKPGNKDCTIDNGAVSYELMYLSRVYTNISDATVKTNIKSGFLKGVQYLLDAQYDNGGWPQFYPFKGGYADHITYNDDAMVNVMEILRHIYLKDSEYSIKAEDSMVAAAKLAFDNGLQCILNTQYVRNGMLTVWCAQHHYSTLEPIIARSYELASLSGQESAGIIKLLMSIDNPSKEIIRAIYSSVDWYDKSRITGQRLESFTNSDGKSDKHIVFDPAASDMWARFYTLEDNRPFFSDRDGIMKFSIAEIGYERRNGYSWYGNAGFNVFSSYNTWLPKWGSTLLASPLPDATIYTYTIPVRAYANKNTGKKLLKFELSIDTNKVYTYSSEIIDTTLAGLRLGKHSVVVKAIYEGGYFETDSNMIIVSLPVYSLTVNSGSDGGKYLAGDKITIKANESPKGKMFNKWTGDTEYIEDINDSITIVAIPDKDIVVRATYKYIPTSGVENGYLELTENIFFPNPFTENLSVDLSEIGDARIEIFNLQGQKIHTELVLRGRHSIGIGYIPQGQYILHILSTENQHYSFKIIKR